MKTTHRLPAILLLAALSLLAAAPSPAAEEHSVADSDVAFTYGVRAFNRGDYAEAARLFQEAVAADPGNSEARAWLAAAQQRTLQPEAVAVPGFAGELIAPADEARRFDGRVGAAFGRAENPAQLASGYQAAFPSGIVSDSDSDEITNLDLRLDLRPFAPRGDWSFGVRLEGGQAAFSEIDTLDTRTLRGQAQVSWGRSPSGFVTGPLGFARVSAGRSPVIVLFQAAVEDTEVDGEPYLQTGRAAASLTLPWATMETKLEASFQDLDYDAAPLPPLERDGEVVSLKAGQTFYFGNRNRYLLVSAVAGQRSAGDALAHDFLEGGIEVSLPLGKSLLLQATGSVRDESYDEPASNPRGGLRSDTVLKAGGTLTWSLPHGVRPYLRAAYTDRDSNYVAFLSDPPRSFDRTDTGVGFTWSF